ncbi:phage tail assembly chaperone [Paraburkholderia sediminicola]|uniref:Phage tail assembly chaperone n=1 Tax=Paraburkholderia rhynchosiae TaxID=487049 RepID=A0ACC7NR23_9BURK
MDEWRAYRQALRDMPQQADFPVKAVWPKRPK